MATYGRLYSLILYRYIIFIFITLKKSQQQFSKVDLYEKWITYYERHVRSKTIFLSVGYLQYYFWNDFFHISPDIFRTEFLGEHFRILCFWETKLYIYIYIYIL